jgi:hypothetical protein
MSEKTWSLKACPISGPIDDNSHLQHLLSIGWEPFAVTHDRGSCIVWLRKA